jgi:small GTP-binding protein
MTGNELLIIIKQAVREGWTQLDLCDQEISELPPEIGQLINLRKLDLSRNPLATLPPELGQLNNLRRLDVSGHPLKIQLTAVPLEIGQLTNLAELDLSRNQLTALPPTISQLTNLRWLDLSGNQLTALPPTISQLTNLRWLDISGNRLTALSPRIGQLANLQQLNLQRNQLRALPSEIGQLTNLQQLNLAGNRLTALPPEIAQLTKLQQLNLWRNRLTTLPSEIGQLTRLQQLNLASNELTTLPPEITQLTNLQQLDLAATLQQFLQGGNPLSTLPAEILQLTNLQELNLTDNQLTALPPEIGHLAKLQQLHLRDNRLTALPPEIGHLAKLQQLHLRDNGLMALPPEIGRLANLQQLNLRGNGLTALTPEISRLANLQQLDLDSNQLTALPSEIVQLTNLQQLHLDSNQLTALPSEIGQLTNLRQLHLGDNQLTALPPEIGQLTNLQQLNLRGNQLTALPPEISRLTNLQRLDVGGNHQLTALPPEIGQLTNLQQLQVSFNQLTALPPEIGQLTNLQQLDLRVNQLTAVPPEISRLTNLQRLDVGSNQLTALPPEIGRLTNLQRLDVGSNQLTALPPEIGQLTNLQRLALSRNELTALPSEIVQLTNLQWLDLIGNQLTALPPEIGQLINLQRLDLGSNQLTTLPPTLRQLQELLYDFHLHGNPLPLPPELLGNRENPGNPQDILDAYFQASRPMTEAKLLLVGEGSVGKSSLVERLLWNRPPSDKGKTVGVDIHQWEVNNRQRLTANSQQLTDENPDKIRNTEYGLRVNVWDFGGQELYHATHQFFLTHRSLYLIVLESRKDESANPLDYWLRHVQSFAGDAPVIVVANKSDQHKMILDERGLQLKHPAIKTIVHTSCITGAGINQLRQAIEEALAAMPHLKDRLPLAWFNVKEKLAALSKDTLPYDSYVELCEAEGIAHEAAQRHLARFLHDLGAALNFQDDRRLAGTHVLNPEWVTGGIYHILNADFLQGQGIFCLDDLDRILDRRRYPPEKHAFLLEMMQKFELCISLGDRQRFLIPGLLPKEQPSFDWPAGAAPALEYRYAILPAAVLSRLMVRLHSDIWQGIRWRNGMGVARDGCRALVVAEPIPAAPRLTISLEGPFPHRRHLLASIRAELNVIHNSFVRLEAEEWVSIPGHPGKAIKYQTLLNAEARGKTTYYDGDSDMDLDVRQLLDGIESEAMRRARQIQERLRRCHPAQLNEIAIELGVSDEALAAAVTAKQPTDLMHLIEQKDSPGEWLLRLINRQSVPLTHIERLTLIQGDASMSGDTFHMSGDFRGAILNIKSTLDHTIQTINNLPQANDAERQALQELFKQLQAELIKAPPELEQKAEAVSQTAKALIDTANTEKPNPTMIQITGEGLKKAAENIAAVMPTVLLIATQIVTAVSRLAG